MVAADCMHDPPSSSTTRPSLATSPVHPRPRHETLVAALEAAAAGAGDFVTIHAAREHRALSFRETLEGAWRWSAALRKRGMARGDRVILLLPTGPSFVLALLGTMMAGGVPVPLATPMTFGGIERYLHNLAAIVADSGARLVISYARVREAVRNDATLFGSVEHLLTEADTDGAAPLDPRSASLDARDTALLQYTSGTTGRPKGAVISHGALLANAFAIAHGLGIGANDVGVSWLPLFHDMGLIGVLLTAVAHPYPVHLISPEQFIMHPLRWMELAARVGGTVTAAPNFAFDLCASRAGGLEAGGLASLRVVLNGAEPVHKATVDRFLHRFSPDGLGDRAILPVYGMAESTLAVAFPALGSSVETLSVRRDTLEEQGRIEPLSGTGGHVAVSVGRPVAGTSIRITTASGETLAERTVGHIRVAGPSLMDGYFRNDEASAEALSGGWLYSGDLGFMDDGRLFVTGRAKDLIIQGGRNVYPYDVERIAAEAVGIRQGSVAAFGRPNDARGTDELVVVAELLERDPARRDQLAKTIRGEVLAVLGARVDDVRFWPVGKIPRTTSGKIRRRECARLLGAEEEL